MSELDALWKAVAHLLTHPEKYPIEDLENLAAELHLDVEVARRRDAPLEEGGDI
jgi:hypothetical protein